VLSSCFAPYHKVRLNLPWKLGASVEVDPEGGLQALTVLVSKVTAAPSATNDPTLDTFVVTVMAVLARIIPLNFVPVPNVAELPTAKITLHALALLINLTVEADAVVIVEPIWKMNRAFALPLASRVSFPVT
jgi:hypothetical protein